jgi:hypothetical protein
MMTWIHPPDRLDNPIFVKYLRSRLRVQSLGAAMVVVLVLCICIAWGGYQLKSFESGGAFGTLLALQAVILVVMGASQIGSSVGAARASGILDFHRVSPLTPTGLTLGFFFGAPIREYILFACTLPFSLLCLAFGTPSLRGFLQLMIVLIASAWVLHGLALLNALLGKARANPRGIIGMVIFVFLFGGQLVAGASRSAALVDTDLRLSFYGLSLPWLGVVLLHMGTLLFFLYLSTRRRMSSERIHPLSKIQAIAGLATAAVLTVGNIWNRAEYAILEVVTLYLLVITSILLVLLVTPNRAEYFKGLWRARKQGRASLPWWDDLALNRVFLAIACALVLITATFASTGAVGPAPMGLAANPDVGSFPLAIAVGVLVVAYFGLGHQFFLLRFGGRGSIFFTLFLFFVWLIPLVSGTIMLASMPSEMERSSQVIFALSPVVGMGMTAMVGGAESYSTAVRAAAITPALLFAFVFNSLLVSTRRRAYRAFVAAAAKTGPGIPAVPPAVSNAHAVPHVGLKQESGSV